MDDEIKRAFEALAEGLAQSFSGIEKRFDSVDSKVTGLEQRFDGVDKKIEEIHGLVSDANDRSSRAQTRVEQLHGQIQTNHREAMGHVNALQTRDEARAFHNEQMKRFQSVIDEAEKIGAANARERRLKDVEETVLDIQKTVEKVVKLLFPEKKV